MKTFSAELELILYALKLFLRFDASLAGELIDRAGKIDDWEPVLRLSGRHRVLPFLTLALDRAGAFRKIPAGIQTRLEKDLQNAVLDVRVKILEFKSYNRCLEEAGIPVIPLKGIALAETVYKETPVRRMGDVDILIKEKDLPRADKILQSEEFMTPSLINGWHTPLSEKIDGKGSRIRGTANLDLQWRPRLYIGDEYAEVPLAQAWEAAEPCPALGKNVSILSAAHQANHLLFQAANDFCKEYLFLYQLLDLAMVLEAGHLSKECFVLQEAAPASRNILERLMNAVEEIFFQKIPVIDWSSETWAICLCLSGSPLVPTRKVFITKIAGLPFLSFREKTLMYLGYFIPDAKRLRQDYGTGLKAGWTGWKDHWTRLIVGFIKLTRGLLK
jgi:hypothetical protein